jgi:hypothetical protein
MAPNFLSAVWLGKAFHTVGVQDVESLILVSALFPLVEGWRRKGKKKQKKKKQKKIIMEKGGFPRDGPALLTMQQVTAVSCN